MEKLCYVLVWLKLVVDKGQYGMGILVILFLHIIVAMEKQSEGEDQWR